MRIRESTEKDFRKIISIIKKLHPKWFDSFALNKSIPSDLKIQRGFVAEDREKIIGFLTFSSNEGEAIISWMGVEPKFQGKTVGTKLLKALEIKLRKFGLKELRVETLAESIEYEPYERTRLFYKKMGFKPEKIRKIKSKATGDILDLVTLVKKL